MIRPYTGFPHRAFHTNYRPLGPGQLFLSTRPGSSSLALEYVHRSLPIPVNLQPMNFEMKSKFKKLEIENFPKYILTSYGFCGECMKGFPVAVSSGKPISFNKSDKSGQRLLFRGSSLRWADRSITISIVAF